MSTPEISVQTIMSKPEMETIKMPLGPNWRDEHTIVNTIPWDPAESDVPGPECVRWLNANLWGRSVYHSVEKLLGKKKEDLRAYTFDWMRNGKMAPIRMNSDGAHRSGAFREKLARDVKWMWENGKLDIPLIPESFKARLRGEVEGEPKADALEILEEYALCAYQRDSGHTWASRIEIAALAWAMGIVIRIYAKPEAPAYLTFGYVASVSAPVITLIHVPNPDPTVSFGPTEFYGQLYLGLRKKTSATTPPTVGAVRRAAVAQKRRRE